MSKLAISFYCACVCLAVLTLGAFGQVVTTEPAKPKWGDTLKITYDPKSPGAAFKLGQEVGVTVFQAISGAEVELTLRGGGEGNVAQVRNVIARLVAANKEAK